MQASPRFPDLQPFSNTGVHRPSETAPPLDPTVGLCLWPYGGPRGGGRHFLSEVPLYVSKTVPNEMDKTPPNVLGVAGGKRRGSRLQTLNSQCLLDLLAWVSRRVNPPLILLAGPDYKKIS